jgi:hypothetical protein
MLPVTNLKPIVERLVKYIRLLASDKDGEVIAAARALERALKGIGADFHDLADRIEHPVGELSEAEMQKIYNAGVQEGRRLEQRARAATRFNGEVSFPSPESMALYCYQRKDNLHSEWELEFVTNMAVWTRSARPLSPKQQMNLEKVYIKLGGRI